MVFYPSSSNNSSRISSGNSCDSSTEDPNTNSSISASRNPSRTSSESSLEVPPPEDLQVCLLGVSQHIPPRVFFFGRSCVSTSGNYCRNFSENFCTISFGNSGSFFFESSSRSSCWKSCRIFSGNYLWEFREFPQSISLGVLRGIALVIFL